MPGSGWGRGQQDDVELTLRQLRPVLGVEFAVGETPARALDEGRRLVDADRSRGTLEMRESAEETLVAADVEEARAGRAGHLQRLELVQGARVAGRARE